MPCSRRPKSSLKRRDGPARCLTARLSLGALAVGPFVLLMMSPLHDRIPAIERISQLLQWAATDYILSTFPIVRDSDQAEFGRYRTRDLILGYMAAFAAGDAQSRINA